MAAVRRAIAALLALGIGASACSSSGGSGGQASDASGAGGRRIAAAVASYDLAAGDPERFIVGLFTSSNRFIDYGHARLTFTYVGTRKSGPTVSHGPPIHATGHFIGVAGTTASNPPSHPEAVPPSKGRGVYGARVNFDRAGYWRVSVSVNVAGQGTEHAQAAFQVLKHHQVPAMGEKALRTDNLTLKSDAPRPAIDSRAQGGKPVPDPILHHATIAGSIAHHVPALVVFATPVYCISRFCGPTTDMVERLAKRFGDRANFIHIEIWRNYQHHVINKAAADWLYHGGDLHEPWVFLIGADGRIKARWDNVVNPSEVIPYLKALPRLHR